MFILLQTDQDRCLSWRDNYYGCWDAEWNRRL